jgi:hypothetical protein
LSGLKLAGFLLAPPWSRTAYRPFSSTQPSTSPLCPFSSGAPVRPVATTA